jgi:glycosyltransferase involved in cell wall biosynthesis
MNPLFLILSSPENKIAMPLVAVWMVTYNHEAYIREAVESVMMQQTSFDYKLVIGEDCSTDKTREICIELRDKYPNKIELFLNDHNIGSTANGIKMYEICRDSGAKYLALLDGDDYWTDTSKLEQQVKFLEKNADYSLCFHDVYGLRNGKKRKYSKTDPPDTTDINHLLTHEGYINTTSVVCRNGPHIADMLNKQPNCPFGDFIVYVASAQQGLLKFIPKMMGVYRIHASSMWITLDRKKVFENTLAGYRMLYNQLSKNEGDMLKVRYLMALESYFLQENFSYTEDELEKLMISEMNIEPYVILFLKQNCEERKQAHHYTSQVTFRILFKAIRRKLLNRLKGN